MTNRRFLFRSISRLAPLLALVGCSSLAWQDGDGAYSRVPVGSVVRVERRIPIERDRARAWLRGDRVSMGSGSNRPICGIEVRQLDRDAVQYVQPGEFRVRRVQNMWTEVVLVPPARDGQVRFRLADMGGGGTPMIYEGYHLWLESEDQPNVMRLTCIGIFDEMWEARPPTIEEIRASLGRLATLEIPGETATTPEKG